MKVEPFNLIRMIYIIDLVIVVDFVLIIALAFIRARQDTLRFAKIRSRRERASHQNSKMRYSNRVHGFRDYWSVRLGLGRNTECEDRRMDIENLDEKEVVVEEIEDGRCNVRGLGDEFKSLVNPHELARQYEPQNIVALDGFYLAIEQLPQSHVTGVHEVFTEPLAEEEGEPIEVSWIHFTTILIMVALVIYRLSTVFLPLAEPLAVWIIALFFAPLISGGLVYSLVTFIAATTRKLKEASATIYLYNGQRPEKHYRHAEDAPDWLSAKPYWVFRYLYQWPRELTVNKHFPFVHLPEDWERVDLWSEAETGLVKWIVTDYHWRELWYKADSNLSRILVWPLHNFHTLRPLCIGIEGKGELGDLYVKAHPLRRAWEDHRLKHSLFLHPKSWFEPENLNKFPAGSAHGIDPVTRELSKLWWDKLRYQYGANDYQHKKRMASPAVGRQPALLECLLGIVCEEVKPGEVYLVKCQDRHKRACITKGRMSIQVGDAVTVHPEKARFETNGDIIGKFSLFETDDLESSGLLKRTRDGFVFP